MRLQKLNNLTIVFFIFIACTSLFGNFAADYLQQQSDKAEETRRLSMAYADQLMAGSKYLTNAVRSFAATGDPKFQQAYNKELYETRSRDKAVEGLRAMGTPRQELALIEQAKLMSDTLIDLEKQAFAAGSRGDLKRAVELVYGPEYQQALQAIYDPIKRFYDELKQRSDNDVEEALIQAAQKRHISQIGNVGSYAIMVFIVAFVYKHKIVQPIIDLGGTIQAILKGDDSVSVAHLNEENEIGDLARSLEQYRKMTQAMDAQNWIETNIGKVATLLQQAQTASDLAHSLLSYISPLLGIGYAALYAHDPSTNRYCLTGAYGNPPGRENTSFAMGESLVGQCALEKAAINLSNLPDDYVHIYSALGDAKPKHLCLLPVLLQDRVLGVLELAAFRDFSVTERAFLSELLPTLSLTMEVLCRNLQTQKLLQETQVQAQRMEKQAALLEEQTIELEAQQTELKDTEAWYYNIIELAPQGMLVCDEAGTIILCNPMADGFFAYDKGELIGKSIDELLPPSVRTEYPLLREQFLSSDDHRRIERGMAIRGLRKDGSEFPFEVNLSLLPATASHDKCIFVSVREAAEPCADH